MAMAKPFFLPLLLFFSIFVAVTSSRSIPTAAAPSPSSTLIPPAAAPSPSNAIPPATAPSPSTVIPHPPPLPLLDCHPQPPLPLPRQSSPCTAPSPPLIDSHPPAPLPPLDCHPPAAAPSPSTAPEPVLGPIHTEGWNYSYVCDPERFTIMGLAVDDFVYCDNSQPYDVRVADLVWCMTLPEKVA
ncbi:hypothetical protein ACMD2_02536 [Ananas comosus]|uniref:Uncharacterized protein n=1 Tax=Ananas comosus TaxID=4615 RepID=A0A199V930_ANACO|nr:hypothetical protein ACMD2_02536 [Ananas comosus]